MTAPQRIVIIGATSAIAEHCARLWCSRGAADVVLVGRDAGRLERVAADLRVRSPASSIRCEVADFVDPTAIDRTVDAIAAERRVDTVLIAHGSLPDQTACETDLVACREALDVNGISPVLFAEAFAGRMLSAGRGRIGLIGSVAGDRGRQSNYVYGAAKGLVARYAQGLQHRLAATAVTVTLIKPGPTDTPMTASMKSAGLKVAPVEDVATRIVDAIAAGRPTVYAPARWGLVMQVIRHLPRFVFDRMRI